MKNSFTSFVYLPQITLELNFRGQGWVNTTHHWCLCYPLLHQFQKEKSGKIAEGDQEWSDVKKKKTVRLIAMVTLLLFPLPPKVCISHETWTPVLCEHLLALGVSGQASMLPTVMCGPCRYWGHHMNFGNRNISKVRHFRVDKLQIFMQLRKRFLLQAIVPRKRNQKVPSPRAPFVCVICKMLGSQLMAANCLALERRDKDERKWAH